MKTNSEKLFERICNELNINCNRLDEGDRKTPDYLLSLSGTEVIAEVKEIERNKAEQESDRLLKKRGYGSCLSNTPGDRIRSKIRKASPQIKQRTEGKKPGVLVLYDRGQSYGHLDPYNIRVAMHGLEQVHISIPNEMTESPTFTGMSHGAKRKMTENDNTSISAIAVLRATSKDNIKIDIYHNKHAAVPLDPQVIANYEIDQYILEEGPDVPTSEWKKYEE